MIPYASNMLNQVIDQRDALLAEIADSAAREADCRNRAEVAEGKIAAGLALADKWEHGALRWADPLPVPPEVGLIREALQ